MMNDSPFSGKNYDLREDIKAYWSDRAATFDLSPWHEIFSQRERAAWLELIKKHLGEGNGRYALDLASGTGVISCLMDDLGFKVTGLDWSQPMLSQARTKAERQGRSINFSLGDAENTMEPDDSFDVIINRHLVWTLVDPQAAFAEWFRVLKPGGKLLIIDGDFVNISWHERALAKTVKFLQRTKIMRRDTPTQPADLEARNRDICQRLYFARQGSGASLVTAMLEQSGFAPIILDRRGLHHVYRLKARNLGFLRALLHSAHHRYVLLAQKPEENKKI